MNEDGGTIFTFGALVGIALSLFLLKTFNCPNHHITSFEEKPYCEIKTVSGKNFKRCLKAVEVSPSGE